MVIFKLTVAYKLLQKVYCTKHYFVAKKSRNCPESVLTGIRTEDHFKFHMRI